MGLNANVHFPSFCLFRQLKPMHHAGRHLHVMVICRLLHAQFRRHPSLSVSVSSNWSSVTELHAQLIFAYAKCKSSS